ncbi:xanthine dehydrogenase [Mycobacterium ulcerans str. Harvey]|uniref:Xanthine dehydrogenase n=1 Tax=Mycobacterium ulcerans str. Harvey TaxID=1299332 RepID=A0ABN0R7Z3_MYCUL|nr:xanthine dehydrogenase [Mycobacterium ulcerans str. Harvey]
MEGAVYESAGEVTRTGIPRLERYGVSDDDAFAVGLTCGGIIDIFIEAVSPATFPELVAVAEDIAAHVPVAVATVIAHPDAQWVGRRLVVRTDPSRPTAGSLGSVRADAAVTDDARGLLALGRSEILKYGPDGQRRGEGMEIFVSSFAPRPRMLVFVPSTSPRRWPGRVRFLATGLPSATPARCSRRGRASRRPTRLSSNGPAGISPPRCRRVPSTNAR